jgi:Protein-tyrosine-phosphatase
MAKIKLHFVCNGNVFRSRLAAAYAASYQLEDIEITTSGLLTYKYDDQEDSYVSPWALDIAKRDGIESFLVRGKRTKTSTELLEDQDIIVFMNDDVFDNAKVQYEFNEQKAIIWHIKDRQEWKKSLRLTARQRKIRTRKHIRARVRELMKMITETGWVDIYSEKNKPLGYKLPVRMANGRALWHRGCHVVITTPNGGTLVQKRSKTIYFSPNLIDITLGGHVDAGETVTRAMLREIFEETGIVAKPAQLRPVELYKQSGYHPRQKVHNKAFIYTFHLKINSDDPDLVLQKKEVSFMKVLKPKQVDRLIRKRYLEKLGRLNYSYEYYKRIIEEIRSAD